VLEGEDLHEQVKHFRTDVLSAYITGATTEGRPEDWDLDALWTALKAVYPVSITPDEVVDQAGGPTRLSAELIEREILSDAEHAYAEREEQIGSDNMRQLERRVTLSVLDRKWREHLYEMDYLKEGIGLRAMAQRDPLVEYQREGYQLFNAMTDAIKEETVGYLYNLEVQVAQPDAPAVTADSAVAAAASAGAQAALPRSVSDGPTPGRLVAKGIDGPEQRAPLQYSAPSVDGDGGVVTRGDAGGKNAGARPAAADGDANREARRKAAKQQRKR
jgi:preprotein translocase subunit SecA